MCWHSWPRQINHNWAEKLTFITDKTSQKILVRAITIATFSWYRDATLFVGTFPWVRPWWNPQLSRTTYITVRIRRKRHSISWGSLKSQRQWKAFVIRTQHSQILKN